MKLTGQSVTIFVTDEGERILKLAGVSLPVSNLLFVSVEEAEESGLWVRLPGEDQMHLFLLLWEFILGIDLPSGLGKVVGLKG